MADRYAITYDGSEFRVSQSAGVIVGGYKTKLEAQQNIEACQQDDLLDAEDSEKSGQKSCRCVNANSSYRPPDRARLD